MKHKFVLRPIFALFCTGLLFADLQAQIFETTIGALAGNDEVQDSKPLPESRYILLSNTTSYGATSKILLTRLNALGAVEMHATLHDAASPSVPYFGAAIDLDRSSTGTHTGYFITGYRATSTGNQIVLLRTNLIGALSWAKVLPATNSSDERGVSVERQSNGDVIVVGNSRNLSTGLNRFVVARFNPVGGQVWSFRYAGAAGSGFEATEACNGMRSGVPVIAITGNANNHTFLSCVDAATGNELWRQVYNSGFSNDAGVDVVYKAANGAAEPERFMVVGWAGLGHPVLWVMRVNPVTGASSNKTYAPAIFYSAFTPGAVSLDATGTRAAISGRISAQIQPSTFLNGTFVMVLPFFGAELPDWTYYYTGSNPSANGRQSISRIAGSGYLVSCGGRLAASALADMHVIRTNTTGSNGGACSRISIPVSRTPGGTSTSASFSKTTTSWTNFTLTRTTRLFLQETCGSSPLDSTGEERSDLGFDEPSIRFPEPILFPNPSAGNEHVRLQIELPERNRVQVNVVDLSGRTVLAIDETREAGLQEIELPTRQWTSGSYIVRVQTEVIQKALKLIVTDGR